LDHPVGRVGAVVTNGQAGTTDKLVAARWFLPDTIDSFTMSIIRQPFTLISVISNTTTVHINRIDDFTIEMRTTHPPVYQSQLRCAVLERRLNNVFHEYMIVR